MAFLPQRLLRLTGFSSTYLTGTAGNNGEIYYDIQTKSLRIMDGALKGGYQLARTDLNNVTNANFLAKATSAGVIGVQSGLEGRLAYYPSNGTQVNDLAEVYWHTHDGASMLHVNGLIDVSGAKNRIRFHWDTLTDLNNEVNPATYHGMIAHVHSTGSVYFAHAGSWNRLANASELTAVPTSVNIGTTNVSFSRASASQTLSGVSIDGNSGTVTNGVYTSGSYSNPSWITSLAYSKLTGTPSLAAVAATGLYSDLTGTPSIPAAYSVTSINALSDVDTTTTPPTAGQVLKWNGTNWAPAADATTGGAGTDADTLDGFDSTYYLNYNNLSNKPTLNGFNLAGPASIVASNGISVTTDADARTISLGISPTLFTVAADDSTQRSINRGEVIKFVGSNGITTASDAEGTITISGSGAGSGTVTSVSVASANGFTGTVATATSTPSITIATSITGLVKGNGTAISAAVAGTDYQQPLTLTTTGTSGAATLVGTTLNIPQYSGGSSNSFETITVAGQTNVVADSSTDTLTLVAGTGISITTNAGTDTITITNTVSAGATAFTGLSDVSLATLTVDQIYLPAITRLVTTNNGATSYRFDQYSTTDNPTIYAVSGTTIAFGLSVAGHPFLIQTSGGANYNTGLVHVSTAGSVTTGSSAQGQTSGTLYWKIPYNTTGNYRYQCSAHGGMQGTINIRDIATI